MRVLFWYECGSDFALANGSRVLVVSDELKSVGGGMMFTPVAGAVSLSPVKTGGHDHVHGLACACGHDHGAEGEGHSHSGVGLDFQLTVLLPVSIACLVLAAGSVAVGGAQGVADVLGLVATVIAGGPIIWSAIKGLAKGQTNENELVAMIIIGAVSFGWYVEAGLVALILQIGALIEGVATESAMSGVGFAGFEAPKHKAGETDQWGCGGEGRGVAGGGCFGSAGGGKGCGGWEVDKWGDGGG